MNKIIFFLVLAQHVCAQKTYEGRVEDKGTGTPVSFASIGIVGTSKGTATNLEGQFSLVAPETASIKITCVGYESMVVDRLLDNQVFQLKASTIRLKDVTVFGKDMSGERIVMRAFRSISKNYNTAPFVQKFFYRHYCKDDSVYGRLIEAAVDVWKRKGYRLQQPSVGYKEELRVTQVRRSFDKTQVSRLHMPISINLILESDIVGYQLKTANSFLSINSSVSHLRTKRKNYDFNLQGVSTYDGQEVYEVHYKTKLILGLAGAGVHFSQSGVLYITTKTSAIVKSERTITALNDTTHTSTYYREYEGKYYPYHMIKYGEHYFEKQNFRHRFHIELMSTEIQKKGFEKFKGREPDKESLFNIPFDSTFWNNYSTLKATPLENSIISDLGGNQSLNKQFSEYLAVEGKNFFGGKEGEENFNRFRDESRGNRILYIDFWASWCAPCIQEMVNEKKLLEQYYGKITFVLLSLDTSDKVWKTAVEKYKLRPGFIHFRIGPQSDVALFYIKQGIPHYVLVRKNGEHFAVDAKRPSNPELKEDFETVIRENR